MTSDHDKRSDASPDSGKQDDATNKKSADKKSAGKETKDTPEWAGGLKQLYDSVVEEPLPSSFLDLLNELDAPSGDKK